MIPKTKEKNSSQPVVELSGAGKCYHIYENPQDRLKQIVWGKQHQYYREFWAVRDISFKLSRGNALGIIGRNGSGKSTLLQMICGTLSPTEGNIETNGRIAALLELGSGFNPDFTGIENIYLNAALLGLSRKETDSKLEDILGFADIGEFAKQPVKTYSSGMAVRLAFSVIAHVDADILIVDEALAVGDAYFTQKCMRFIQRHREENCLLFVSHDATAVMSLCETAILLDHGKLIKTGAPKEVITEYIKNLHDADSQLKSYNLASSTEESGASEKEREIPCVQSNANTNTQKWSDYRAGYINNSTQANRINISRFDECLLNSESFGTGKAVIVNVKLLQEPLDNLIDVAFGGEIVSLKIEIKAKEYIEMPIAGFILKNDKGLTLLGDNTLNAVPPIKTKPVFAGGHLEAHFNFTLPLLPAGNYSITASVAEGTQANHKLLHWLNDALIFRSECTSIAAGLAGVAMHKIELAIGE